jgi:hypothetical protein
MKKSTLITTISFAFMMLLSFNVNAQKFPGLDKSPLDISMTKDKSVKVIYSRPQLNGRDLSTLTPSDLVWRTGANESTEVTFYNDVNFGGKKVKAGTYSLFTIPNKSEWTIILNSDLNTWGAFSYNEAHDVTRVKATPSTGEESLEAFTIAFGEDGTMHMAWGKTRVAIPIN